MNHNYSQHYFRLKGEKAEKILHSLATKTFLEDWCFLNPKLPNGKEICDLLVIFDDSAIIWQIKDLKLNKNGKYNKSDVDKNLRQLSGARRKLIDLKTPIKLENPKRSVEIFDSTQIKRVFLISVLIGEGEEYFSFIDEIKNHKVHVFTREFTEISLNELDTVRDFIEYLVAKEQFIDSGKALTIIGGEQDFLAFYLQNGRSFQRFDKANYIVIDGDLWENLSNKPQYKAKKKEDEISYLWDSIIKRAHEGSENYEKVARELARPSRFQRRYLSKVFFEAHILAHNEKKCDLFRRVMPGEDGVTYCFLFQDDPESRERRKSMLSAICWVARGKYKENKKVLGIATEKQIRPTCSYDFVYMYFPEWTEEQQKYTEELQEKTGIFVNSIVKKASEDEYPKIENNLADNNALQGT